MITIDSLKNIPSNKLFEAFEDAFNEYEIQLDQIELSKMLKRRGFQAELSFGAFDGNRLVAFTFNGIGPYQGIKTAYDTGTGTVKEYRGRGLAKQIFRYSLPYLREAGIKRYLLEVLQHNSSAVKLYQSLGFEVSREFYYFVQETGKFKPEQKSLKQGYSLSAVDIAELSDKLEFADFPASWQNGFESVIRSIEEFKAIAAYYQNKIAAYCIYEPRSGDITNLAVAKVHRRLGLGTTLLMNVLQDNHADSFKLINIPTDANAMLSFLASFDIHPSGKQFEMIKVL